ncbi:hypothetical protein [Segetibacter aerophilus]|uniref:Uncharacterized protein n=1 Tax=Segetibacter aerophilus TaxID=670293 RepID=A0A512BI12_9BACT|nr:hypothetical protein [Segetibacter aerophilus]GEO11457.1 hypothetical protein SAE01_39530 [Segetibacter aerophilus]
MKHKTNFRLILAILAVGIVVLFLEKRRTENRRNATKETRKINNEETNFNVSNTDYIFFEPLSKYLFISLEN